MLEGILKLETQLVLLEETKINAGEKHVCSARVENKYIHLPGQVSLGTASGIISQATLGKCIEAKYEVMQVSCELLVKPVPLARLIA